MMLLGMLLVLSILICYGLKTHGISSPLIAVLTKNVSSPTPISQALSTGKGKYDRQQSLPEKLETVAVGYKDTIENFSTGSIPGNRYFKITADLFHQRLMHFNLAAIPGGKTNREFAEEAFHEVHLFSEYVAEQGIDFLYVQLPSPTRLMIRLGEIKNEGESASTLEMSEFFTELMEQSGTPFLDISGNAEFVETLGLDMSAHWLTVDALRCTEMITEKLNRLYGLGFNTGLYDLARYRNALLDAPEVAASIEEEVGYSYEFLVPKASPDYTVLENDKNLYEGSFLDTLVSPKENWDRRTDDGSAISYHDMWRLRNGTYLDITNLDPSVSLAGKKVLILGDSFSWPISAYLSQDVGEVFALHPRYFNGDVRTCIDLYQPDLIIWMYVEEQIGAFNRQNFSVVN